MSDRQGRPLYGSRILHGEIAGEKFVHIFAESGGNFGYTFSVLTEVYKQFNAVLSMLVLFSIIAAFLFN